LRSSQLRTGSNRGEFPVLSLGMRSESGQKGTHCQMPLGDMSIDSEVASPRKNIKNRVFEIWQGYNIERVSEV
jgi:hypothetical protein